MRRKIDSSRKLCRFINRTSLKVSLKSKTNLYSLHGSLCRFINRIRLKEGLKRKPYVHPSPSRGMSGFKFPCNQRAGIFEVQGACLKYQAKMELGR